MSLTARERQNPPPRRKACAACIKAKRRCDFALPACLRCGQRNLPCEYPSRAPRQDHDRRRIPKKSDSAALWTSPQVMNGIAWEEPSSSSSSTTTTTPPVCVDTGSSNNADFISPIFQPDLKEPSDGFPLFDEPLRDEIPVDLFAEVDHLSLIFQPHSIVPATTKEWDIPPKRVWEKTKYIIDEVKKAPASMVFELGTPWCHPLIYDEEMPRSMQDALACCSLYLSKNRVNSSVIFHAINAKCQELLREPTPITALESLAHTQSLLLYQILRLFDGNISARIAAESVIPSLETSVLCLLSYCSFDISPSTCHVNLPLFPLAETQAFWKEWALAESIRRTVIFTFLLLTVYRVLAGLNTPSCDPKVGLFHSWTLSAYLWGAKSATEFAQAWSEKNHFVVKNAQYGPVLAEANADDLDGFGKMFLSGLLGFEEAEGWFKSKGGEFVPAGRTLL